jgi:phosphate uptake regulator
MEFRKLGITGGSSFTITLPKKWADFHHLRGGSDLEFHIHDNGDLVLNPLYERDTRRIQSKGGTSLVVTLPKQWINDHKLSKGDEIALISQENGQLILNCEVDTVRESMNKNFEISKDDNPEILFRKLIASYVMGFASITISCAESIPSPIRDVAQKFTKMVIGMVMEVEDNVLTIRETINISDFGFEKGIKDMERQAKSMINDIFVTLSDKDPSPLTQIIDRDESINARHRLIRRQMNRIIQKSHIPIYSKIKISDLKQNFLLSQNIERIGDNSVRIASILLDDFTLSVHPNELKRLRTLWDLILSNLSKGIRAWQTRDMKLANSCINKFDEYFHKNRILFETKNTCDSPVTYYLILELLRKSAMLAANISEIVIDHIITN